MDIATRNEAVDQMDYINRIIEDSMNQHVGNKIYTRTITKDEVVQLMEACDYLSGAAINLKACFKE